jgi:putative proteasome-type protease
MTYCLGIKVKQGLLALADTRITSGTETTIAKKYVTHLSDQHALFIMTSGLRSVRDKALTYFKEVIDNDSAFTKMYQAANALGAQIKRAAKEDKKSLQASGLSFDLNTILGGQLENDEEPKIFLIYPEGNWIELGEGSPFIIIGNSGYGKPILRRTISSNSSLATALKSGFLSFDSTRVSANDVDFPIDVIVYKTNSYKFKIKRYELDEMFEISKIWGEKLKESIESIPDDWMKKILED